MSLLFLIFCFPLRLEVSLLFLDIKTKAEVRNAAESWKLGVKRNEECFFADWPIVVLMVSSWVATDKLTWCNKRPRGNYTECHRRGVVPMSPIIVVCKSVYMSFLFKVTLKQ